MKQEEKHIPEPDSLITITEIERLTRDIYCPDMEKLRLFTKMLRTNQLLKKAIIHHK